MSTDKTQSEIIDKEFLQWLSTYGLVTVQRIFDLFHFDIEYTNAKEILNNKNRVYYNFLRVPFINIFNNIIISQVEGYREYIQKIFIDYLLSGAANETNAPSQGASIRETLEEDRQKFMSLADEFDIECFNHNSLIADSQASLIKMAKGKFKNMEEVQDSDKQELLELVENFEEKGKLLTAKFRDFRRLFQEMIVTTQELMDTLPNYQVDEQQLEMYKESINFDTNIGGDEV